MRNRWSLRLILVEMGIFWIFIYTGRISMFINFEGNMMFNRFNGTLCKLFSVVAVGMALSQPSFAEKPAMDVSRVYVAGSNAKVSMAHSVLLRTDKRLAFRVQTRDLEPGAYTLWLVYFNDPEKCI